MSESTDNMNLLTDNKIGPALQARGQKCLSKDDVHISFLLNNSAKKYAKISI